MKRIILSLIFPFFMLVFFSCDDFLSRQPLTSLSADKFWKTKGDVEAWNIGMYDALQRTLGHNYFLWGEVRSDNQQQAGTGTTQALYLSSTLTANLAICDWTQLYRTIAIANFTVKYLKGATIDNLTEEEVSQFIGQAYVTRALMYFYAIRVWGDCPLILEPYEGLPGQEENNPRAKIEDVKSQILKDIESALSCLSSTSISSVNHFNRGAALAVLTDVHMWFKEYQQALDATNLLMSLKRYDLAQNTTEWHTIFENPSASKEAIFSLGWDASTDDKNGIAAFISGSGTNPNYKVRKPLWDELIARGKHDDRLYYMTDTLAMWYRNGRLPITEETYDIYVLNFFNNKFLKYNPSKSNSEIHIGMPSGGWDMPLTNTYMPQIPIYRYSDIMLLRAEALNKLGDGDGAREIVNQIRARIGYKHEELIPDPSFVPDPNNPNQEVPTISVVVGEVTVENAPNGDALEAVILEERQFELWGEGKRWFDLIRTGKVLEVMDPILRESYGVAEGFTDPRLILFPLHSSVFETNPLLEQNEPYTKY